MDLRHTLLMGLVGIAACRTPMVSSQAEEPRAAVSANSGTAVPSRKPDQRFVPAGPAAAHYAAAGEVAGRQSDALVAEIIAEVKRAARVAHWPTLERDARLDQVAADIGRWAADGQLPRLEDIAFLLGHYGVVEPEPSVLLVRGSAGSETSILNELREKLPALRQEGARARLGIGVRRDKSEVAVTLAFQEQNLELSSVPRHLPSGGSAVVAGRLLGALSDPEVLVSEPKGTVRKLAATRSRTEFKATLVCDAGDGAYQLEVSGTDARGPIVAANFPVFCGVEPPSRALVKAGGAATQDVSSASNDLLALLNRDRKAAGLPALTLDLRLAEVARAHSREMADTGEVAHISRTTGSAMDRIRAARLSPVPNLVAENVGSALSAAEAEHGFMSSPGHRANIMSAGITHVGIGVAVGKNEGGVALLYFTQLFAGWER